MWLRAVRVVKVSPLVVLMMQFIHSIDAAANLASMTASTVCVCVCVCVLQNAWASVLPLTTTDEF